MSSNTVSEVAFCLASKNNVPVLDRQDGSKVVLFKGTYGVVAAAFSIYPSGAGSRIEYRRKIGSVGHIWKQCVNGQIKPI